VRKSAMNAFRHLPPPVRRRLVRLGSPAFTVGTVAVLQRDDGQIALVEQRHTGAWALPGGLIGRGEQAAAALVRELCEELGLRLDPAALPVPAAVVTPGARRVDVVYRIAVGAGPPLVGADDVEVLRTGWFPLDALPAVTEPTRDILAGVGLL
jgi:8-oxo-dGTP pyrophosphatase MutT (NUDIX family)